MKLYFRVRGRFWSPVHKYCSSFTALTCMYCMLLWKQLFLFVDMSQQYTMWHSQQSFLHNRGNGIKKIVLAISEINGRSRFFNGVGGRNLTSKCKGECWPCASSYSAISVTSQQINLPEKLAADGMRPPPLSRIAGSVAFTPHGQHRVSRYR